MDPQLLRRRMQRLGVTEGVDDNMDDDGDQSSEARFSDTVEHRQEGMEDEGEEEEEEQASTEEEGQPAHPMYNFAALPCDEWLFGEQFSEADDQALEEDDDYCYLCNTCDDERNNYRARIYEFVSRFGRIHPRKICQYIERYYNTWLREFTQRNWNYHKIYEHFTQHELNRRIATAENARFLVELISHLRKFIRRADAAGTEIPPSDRQINTILKVMKVQDQMLTQLDLL